MRMFNENLFKTTTAFKKKRKSNTNKYLHSDDKINKFAIYYKCFFQKHINIFSF